MNDIKIVKNLIITIIIGLFLSTIAYKAISKNQEKSNEQELIKLFKQKASLIQSELNLNIEILLSTKSLFDASENVTRDEFENFTMSSINRHKSIQALSWLPRIPHELKDEYELKTQKDLGFDFIIKEKSPEGGMTKVRAKKEYFPVDYIVPLKGNKKAIGFDISSSKVRLETLNMARKTNKPRATARITLIQEKAKQFGFLVVVPVWDNSNILKGYSSAVFRIGDILNTALSKIKDKTPFVDIWLVDTTNKKNRQLLYTNTNTEKIVMSKYSEPIEIEGRTWTLYAKQSKLFIEKNSSLLPEISFLSMMFIVMLIGYIISLKTVKAKELEMLVDEKTKDLRESNKKFEILLSRFDEKVIASSTDTKGIIKYATEAFSKISGYSKEELIGHNHNIVGHDDMPKSLFKELWTTIKAGKVFNCELKNKRKDGTHYWVDVTITPEFDKENNIVSYFAIREDITAKKEVVDLNRTLYEKVYEEVAKNQKKDQLLLQQSKMASMGEMIGAIAHQWRQPLNTLAMSVQFIEDDFEDGIIDKEYVKEHSKENMKLINFMSKTIDDFRNFFQVNKAKENFDVKQKIEETTSMMLGQFANHNISLKINGTSFIMNGFPNEFQQVILNIINNAKDAFIEKGIDNGNIDIDIQTSDNIGTITIKDNAQGIPQEIIDRVFEPYFTTKEQGKGTGVGLYMSKMIVEDNMDGKLYVNNTDNGAKFTLELDLVIE